MNKKENINNWIPLIIMAIIFYWLINNMAFVGGIIYKIFRVLLPFILGCVIAFVLNIPMTKIENKLNKLIKNQKTSIRIISIVLSLILFILLIGFVLFLLIPEVIKSIESLIEQAPTIINNTEIWLIDLLDKYPNIQQELENIFAKNSFDNVLPGMLNYIVNWAISFISSLVSGFAILFTAVVFSLYILSQKEYMLKGTKKILTAYLKPKTVNKIEGVAKLTNNTFQKFLSGQCVEAVILGTIFFIVLSIFKFPYALIISVLTTITALIPIFGAMIAMCVGAILIAIESPFQALIFIIVFQVIQQIEGNFIYPRVVGKSVGLSPLWTLFAITVGGSLWGIMGMLTALPIASILYAILKENISKRLSEERKVKSEK